MPTTNDDLYDSETDTVRVGRRDLARLLLEFRNLLELHEAGWAHMEDWDVSFERLADAVDAGNRAALGSGPDPRMRCKPSPQYRWPEGGPYDGGPVTAVRVRDKATRADHGSHYMPTRPDGRSMRTLCGLGFAREESKPVTGEPDCRQCRREVALAEPWAPGKA